MNAITPLVKIAFTYEDAFEESTHIPLAMFEPFTKDRASVERFLLKLFIVWDVRYPDQKLAKIEVIMPGEIEANDVPIFRRFGAFHYANHNAADLLERAMKDGWKPVIGSQEPVVKRSFTSDDLIAYLERASEMYGRGTSVRVFSDRSFSVDSPDEETLFDGVGFPTNLPDLSNMNPIQRFIKEVDSAKVLTDSERSAVEAFFDWMESSNMLRE